MEIEKIEELTAIIDWLQVTFKNADLEDVMYIFRLNKSDMYYEDVGRFRYKGKWVFGRIEILVPPDDNEKMGYHVYLTGSACREVEIYLKTQKRNWFDVLEECMEWNVNFSRLDIAIDDRKTYFKIKTLGRKVDNVECVSRYRNWNFINGGTMGGKRTGCTLNMGARDSNCSMVFYEKNYEQAKKMNVEPESLGKWNRYEIRMRSEVALNCVKKMVEKRDICFVGKSIMNYYVRLAVVNPNNKQRTRWKTWKPWERFMIGMEKIKLSERPAPRTLEQTEYWIENYVAPCLKMVRESKLKLGLPDPIDTIIRAAKLQEKHKKIMDDYVNGVEQMKSLEVERKKELVDFLELKSAGFSEIFMEKDNPFLDK